MKRVRVVKAENAPCGRHDTVHHKPIGVVVFRGQIRVVWRCGESCHVRPQPVPSREVPR